MKLEEIEFKNNTINTGFLMKYWEDKFTKMEKKLKIDLFDVCAFMDPERLERTVWIPTGDEPKKNEIFNEIENSERNCIKKENSHVGIPLFIRKKRGRKEGRKKDNCCKNVFIEFMYPNSVNRMLKLAATSQFKIKGIAKKVFKAGTKPDYLLVKKRVNK